MKRVLLLPSLILLPFISGCENEETTIELNQSSPFFISDFISHNAVEVDNTVQKSLNVIYPQITLSLKPTTSLYQDLQIINPTTEIPTVNQFILKNFSQNISNTDYNNDSNIVLFLFEPDDSNSNYNIVSYFSSIPEESKLTKSHTAPGGFSTTDEVLKELFTNNLDSYQQIIPDVYEVIRVDIPYKAEYSQLLSQYINNLSIISEFQPLIEILYSFSDQLEKIILSIDINSASQEVSLNLSLPITNSSLIGTALSNSIGSNIELARSISALNATSLTLNQLNNNALFDYLKTHPTTSSVIAKLLQGYLNLTTGNTVSSKYVISGKEQFITVIELNNNDHSTAQEFIIETLNYLQERFQRYSKLTKAYSIKLNETNTYIYTPFLFQKNSSIPDTYTKPHPNYFYGFINNYVIISSTNELLLETIASLSNNIKPEPSILSSSQINPFTISYTTTNLGQLLNTLNAPVNILQLIHALRINPQIPITFQIEVKESSLNLRISTQASNVSHLFFLQ